MNRSTPQLTFNRIAGQCRLSYPIALLYPATYNCEFKLASLKALREGAAWKPGNTTLQSRLR